MPDEEQIRLQANLMQTTHVTMFVVALLTSISIPRPLGGAIAAAGIAGRGKLRVLAQPLVGFAIWMIGVGFANAWLIGEIGAGI
jgi:hypothetical protein